MKVRCNIFVYPQTTQEIKYLEIMLRNCFLPVNYNKPREKCCGEIVYQSFDEFVFLCKLCKLKIFEFHDFVKHLKHVHEEELVGDSGNKNIDTDNTITNNDLDGSKEKDQHILKFEIDNNRYHPIRSELNGEIEETFEFDNDEISWQDNTDDNERDRSFTGSDSEKPDEEEVKSIIRKVCSKSAKCKHCFYMYFSSFHVC